MKRNRPDLAKRRFERQFSYFSARLPVIERLRKPGSTIARISIGILLIIGGLLAILPVLNVWMIPLGLLILAIDLPLLQGPVTRLIIFGRWKIGNLRRFWFRRGA